MHKVNQTRQPCGESCSEYQDLVNAVGELRDKSASCLEELNSLYGCFMQATPGSRDEIDTIAPMWKIAAGIGKQYQQVDTHYSRVLASDLALVNKEIRTRFGMDIDGKICLKNAVEKLKVIRRLVAES